MGKAVTRQNRASITAKLRGVRSVNIPCREGKLMACAVQPAVTRYILSVVSYLVRLCLSKKKREKFTVVTDTNHDGQTKRRWRERDVKLRLQVQ